MIEATPAIRRTLFPVFEMAMDLARDLGMNKRQALAALAIFLDGELDARLGSEEPADGIVKIREWLHVQKMSPLQAAPIFKFVLKLLSHLGVHEVHALSLMGTYMIEYSYEVLGHDDPERLEDISAGRGVPK